jgi:septal ring factor EnvC (AmiA/AmiB activator)
MDGTRTKGPGVSDALYRDGYSQVWADLERLQKENAALKQTLEFTVNDAFESRETVASLKQQNEGLRSELLRVKGVLKELCDAIQTVSDAEDTWWPYVGVRGIYERARDTG